MEYKYSALNKEGGTETDRINAGSYHEAVKALHDKGLIPTDISEMKTSFFSGLVSRFSTVSLQDKILFIQNLSVMVKAGIPLIKALKILANQTKNPKLKVILEEVHAGVESGKPMAELLSLYPTVFSNIFVSMFQVGEASGTLDNSLEHLTIQMQREHDLISKVKGAMIYPAVIIFAIVTVGVLMSIFVLPSLVGIFKDSGMKLPLTTRVVIAFVDFMSGHTLLALTLIFGSVGGVFAILQTTAGKRGFDKILLKIPVFGAIAKKINIARFSRTMSSMLKSGTPILESLQTAANGLGNSQYQDAVTAAVVDVRSGQSLTSALEKYPKLFDYLVTQMIGVGEESGNVDQILVETANHYEQEVDETMKNFSSVIEPVMILVIGAVVGVLALALISPIYNLTQGAG